jgi:signal transduction histidine kinase
VSNRHNYKAARLAALYQYQILDTEPEKAFDNIAQLAALICETPIACINFIDDNRQWLKAKVGFKISEIPYNTGFCPFCIQTKEIVIIGDTWSDECWAKNSVVINYPHVRFYAGVPLIIKEEYPIATLCVMDNIPRDLKKSQITGLKMLARQVVAQLEARETQQKYATKESELLAALRFQSRAEEELRRQRKELARSNAELEQFAYIVSHDLQEPLRMVASYLQLFERRYKDKLDTRASEFIAYAVDGAARMQTLINNLLRLSRVSTCGQSFKLIDCNIILHQVFANLKLAIQETEAVITYDKLPEVMGDETQLTQLFQNLISNGIKFRRNMPPQIHITAISREEEDSWLFSVQDNGVGIEKQYIQRIFVIFQRLHSKGKYPGNGIGLAICQKIVERHNGCIWVESEPGEGSIFYFTLPDKPIEGVGG